VSQDNTCRTDVETNYNRSETVVKVQK